jgi:hypothetical protein
MYLIISMFLALRGFRKLKFGQWIDQEMLLDEAKGLKEIISPAYTNIFYNYVNLVTRIPKFILRRLEWRRFISLFGACRKFNEIVSIPLTKVKSKKQSKPDSWDYPGRNRVLWTSLLCRHYGWTVEYVRSLEVSTVFQLAQETLVDRQLEREFLWSMSEIAYPYNSSTKKSEFRELPRPEFMWQQATEPKRFKIPTKLMPIGLVNDVGGMSEYIQKKTKA